MNPACPSFPENPDTLPAILVCEEATASLRVAGFTLLDRLVVTAHRAGCSPVIVVSPDGPQELERAAALKIPVRFAQEVPAITRPVLIACSSILVTPTDIRVLLNRGGRLTDRNGTLLPIGLVLQSAQSVGAALASLAPVVPDDLARRVTDAASAREAEQALWASLTSSSDGLVDRVFNRPCGRPFSRVLVRTGISPNAVSLASVFIGLLAAVLFGSGNYAASVVGAVLFQISAILDCIDGDIARIAFKESAFGKWLDLAGDQLVHIAVFGAIALGLMKTTPESPAMWLGLSAIIGAILSFGVVVRGLRRPLLDRNGRLQKLINAATNRDFSVLVLCMAILGQLDLFLWVTAIGSHVFWITALTLQLAARPAEARAQ